MRPGKKPEKPENPGGFRGLERAPWARALDASPTMPMRVALHFMHYNFSRVHQTLRETPAMAASIISKPFDICGGLSEESIACPQTKVADSTEVLSTPREF